MKVTVDGDTCIGCGVCVSVCPDVFELDDNSVAVVIDGADLSSDCIDEAVENCPVNAIEVE
ncbi:MAG TPA: ferredoxin [Caldisericia bacterium]|nr:ferredoxin [Caldisericia bacterium]HPF48115.1 ferredoxin [Caldisericia bacterium]HPI83948.1 ferredoxin [Caldisericia bacterium]HPQ92568.1 ferredoxin [Caldisericia bacterium]HRV74334.1 ferredoxin [Caldisericia bacterium]